MRHSNPYVDARYPKGNSDIASLATDLIGSNEEY